ncbi:hypothetical protein GO496_04110 [Acidovorax citrulli]|nr:hypothetical protein [Paracidovorax citrulli]
MPKAVVQIGAKARRRAVKSRRAADRLALRELGDTVRLPLFPCRSQSAIRGRRTPSGGFLPPSHSLSSSGVEVAQTASGTATTFDSLGDVTVAHGPPRRLGRGRRALGAGLRRQRRLRGP